MQDVEIYIGDSTALSGTITYQTGNNLTDSTKNFFSNPEIVGNIIVNNTNGKRATVTGIYGDQTIILDVAIADFGSNTNSYSILQNQELLDTFKDETISLTQTVKDIKDVDKIKTNFSKSFTLPASKVNNRVFKHYYRQDIVGGFDARFMVSATIKLNGNKFRDGKIRLLSVKMKNNLPYAYNVNFTGNTVTLKTTFGDDELTDLPYLDVFDHTYSYDNVKSYMQTGYNPIGGGSTSYPELIYPFIGASNNRYYYNSGHTGEGSHDEIDNVRNIYHDGGNIPNTHGDFHSIQYFDLKPAIKVYYVLKAIEV